MASNAEGITSGEYASPRIPRQSTSQEDERGVMFDYDAIEPGDLDIGLESPALSKLREKGHLKKEKLLKKIKEKKAELEKTIKKPVIIRLRDKISFTFGITDVALSMYLLGAAPGMFYWIYTIKLPLLTALRYYLYHKSKTHYYLLDFCYFVNLLVFAYLHVFTQSCTLFKICFSFTCGPLMFAVLAWRNSMVFHSVDKITSLFFHITPTLVIWSIRWYPSGDFNICAAPESTSFVDFALMPLIPYAIWQLAYFVKVQVLDKYKFLIDPTYMTSFKYLVMEKKSLVFKLVNIFGKKYRMWMYGAFQLLYTILTILPVTVYYHYFWVHTLFLFAMCVLSCWNGATFYMDVFSVKYQQTLKDIQEQWNELEKAIEKEPRNLPSHAPNTD